MPIKHHYDHYTLRRLLDQTHCSGLFRDAHKIVAELLHRRRDPREHNQPLHQVEQLAGETKVSLTLLGIRRGSMQNRLEGELKRWDVWCEQGRREAREEEAEGQRVWLRVRGSAQHHQCRVLAEVLCTQPLHQGGHLPVTALHQPLAQQLRHGRIFRRVQHRQHHSAHGGQSCEPAGSPRRLRQHRDDAVEQGGAHGGIAFLQETVEGKLEGRQKKRFFSLHRILCGRFSRFIGESFHQLFHQLCADTSYGNASIYKPMTNHSVIMEQ